MDSGASFEDYLCAWNQVVNKYYYDGGVARRIEQKLHDGLVARSARHQVKRFVRIITETNLEDFESPPFVCSNLLQLYLVLDQINTPVNAEQEFPIPHVHDVLESLGILTHQEMNAQVDAEDSEDEEDVELDQVVQNDDSGKEEEDEDDDESEDESDSNDESDSENGVSDDEGESDSEHDEDSGSDNDGDSTDENSEDGNQEEDDDDEVEVDLIPGRERAKKLQREVTRYLFSIHKVIVSEDPDVWDAWGELIVESETRLKEILRLTEKSVDRYLAIRAQLYESNKIEKDKDTHLNDFGDAIPFLEPSLPFVLFPPEEQNACLQYFVDIVAKNPTVIVPFEEDEEDVEDYEPKCYCQCGCGCACNFDCRCVCNFSCKGNCPEDECTCECECCIYYNAGQEENEVLLGSEVDVMSQITEEDEQGDETDGEPSEDDDERAEEANTEDTSDDSDDDPSDEETSDDD